MQIIGINFRVDSHGAHNNSFGIEKWLVNKPECLAEH